MNLLFCVCVCSYTGKHILYSRLQQKEFKNIGLGTVEPNLHLYILVLDIESRPCSKFNSLAVDLSQASLPKINSKNDLYTDSSVYCLTGDFSTF